MDRLQLIAIKRMAMGTAFCCAGPYDYDNGFDRLMSCKTIEDLSSAVFGDILLHTFLEQNTVDEVKQFVLKEATQMVSAVEHVSWEIAETLLHQVFNERPRQVLENESN